MPPSNTAAWLPAKNTYPVKIGPAAYPSPGPGQIVVRNWAVAINPVDWCLQLFSGFVLTFLVYPMVPGGDLAGDVVEVGADVTDFAVGDRILALGLGMDRAAVEGKTSAAEGAFQKYTLVRTLLATHIPEWMLYQDACVLPLTLATAAYGLFHAEFLALDLPTVPPPPPGSKGRVLITGGSTSVGCNAIQLVVQAGYTVVSTSSPKNFDYVKSLGATAVFDYRSKTLQADLVAALSKDNDTKCLGALAIGDNAVKLSMKVLSRIPGSRHFVSMAGSVMVPANVSTTLGRPRFMGFTVWQGVRMNMTGRSTGVEVKFVDTKDLAQPGNAVRKVFREFLPQALAQRQYMTAPRTRVVGHGLDSLQEAMDVRKKGVSAEKIVLTL
ncbi:hypothetical protein SCUCBS95973_008213 [Sporothrix curviconia]|uniref:Enoyl reductase (ER) domain-containing protein n=1 Tax=Sporothrix curviconia TaxID=1260050 RepID=A0ABP0CJS1_9PEZI